MFSISKKKAKAKKIAFAFELLENVRIHRCPSSIVRHNRNKRIVYGKKVTLALLV